MNNLNQNAERYDIANKVISTILHSGLRKYKARNSKAGLVVLKQQEKFEAKALNGQKNKKGSVFITRSKEHLSNPSGTLGIVLSSEEAALGHIGMATHWTPNVYNYGTYADKARTIIKGHEERNLQQINCFVVDVDTKQDVTPGEIVLAAMDKQLDAPTFILETSKGYHVYFVLDEPLFVTNKNDYRCIAVAKRISENIRKALSEEIDGVDLACNHFGFFRMPNVHNVVWFQENSTCNLAELIDWSKDQDIGLRRKLFTVMSNNSCADFIQINEKWATELLNLTNVKGEKGVIGRDNAMFTLALACYSSGKSEEYAFDLLDQYNTNLTFPVKEEQIRKVIKSAFKGKWKGASKEYVEMLLDTWGNGLAIPFSSEVKRGWYKHKKERKDRVRSHLHEWEEDIIKYLQSNKETKKGFIYFTQKELCEELNIPRSTLNKLLSSTKKIYRHIVGTGNQKRTGLATLAMLFDYVTSKKAEQSESFVALIREFAPVAASKLLSVLKGRKKQGYQGFEGLLARDGTG